MSFLDEAAQEFDDEHATVAQALKESLGVDLPSFQRLRYFIDVATGNVIHVDVGNIETVSNIYMFADPPFKEANGIRYPHLKKKQQTLKTN